MPTQLNPRNDRSQPDPAPSSGLKNRRSAYQSAYVWLFVAATLCAVLYCYHQVQLRHALDASPSRATAIVTNLFVIDKKRGDVDFVSYSYTVDGQKYASHEEVPHAFRNTLHKGQEVPIVYLATDPGTARCLGYTPYDDYTWMLIMYIILFTVGVLTLVASRIWPQKFKRSS